MFLLFFFFVFFFFGGGGWCLFQYCYRPIVFIAHTAELYNQYKLTAAAAAVNTVPNEQEIFLIVSFNCRDCDDELSITIIITISLALSVHVPRGLSYCIAFVLALARIFCKQST